jgi:nucleoside-specific outer membrane channel protein Tsx
MKMNVSTEYDLNMKLQKEYENMIRMNNTASTLAAELECQLEKKYGYKQEELFAIWDEAEESVMGVVK